MLCIVPNAPCGVESLTHHAKALQAYLVPNAPCGVESTLGKSKSSSMRGSFTVPNVPCGVERSRRADSLGLVKFLMYRVELKVDLAIPPPI